MGRLGARKVRANVVRICGAHFPIPPQALGRGVEKGWGMDPKTTIACSPFEIEGCSSLFYTEGHRDFFKPRWPSLVLCGPRCNLLQVFISFRTAQTQHRKAIRGFSPQIFREKFGQFAAKKSQRAKDFSVALLLRNDTTGGVSAKQYPFLPSQTAQAGLLWTSPTTT